MNEINYLYIKTQEIILDGDEQHDPQKGWCPADSELINKPNTGSYEIRRESKLPKKNENIKTEEETEAKTMKKKWWKLWNTQQTLSKQH